MAIAGNKGEWSEIYVFLRLLADGKLFAADEGLNRIQNTYFPIIKITRKETKGAVHEYRANPETNEVEVYLNGHMIWKASTIVFDSEARRLLEDIRSSNGRSIEFPDTEAFIAEIHVRKLKAPSSNKSDICMEVHDIQTGRESKVGFSIKSKLGGLSTLLNASMATNFVYQVKGLDSSDALKINSINTVSKYKDRIKAIVASGGELTFDSMEDRTFEKNLMMVDGQMPRIVAEMLKGYYTGEATSCIQLLELVSKVNPLGRERMNYEYNVKKMLSAVALGMKPTTKWNGVEDASGGYIIVKSDGDVLAYHIHNRNEFYEYLINSTKFDTASGTRYGHCTIYEKEGKLWVKLNLQIRFT